MSYNTFVPVVPPSPGTTDKPKIRLLEAEFGDGYSQSVPDGVNHIARTLDLEWELLTPAQAQTLTDFFRAQQGCIPFWFTPSDELTPVKWICKEWSDRRGDGGMRAVTAKFEQSFLL